MHEVNNMKYLGQEQEVEIVVKRQIKYIRCDRCGKKIIPKQYKTDENQYIHVHTFHNDWGHDSVESHTFNDYCVECAKIVVAEYISNIGGTDELELSNEHLYS
jgi:DNA-directed RNA polymerase subunit RPC12/RpoP